MYEEEVSMWSVMGKVNTDLVQWPLSNTPWSLHQPQLLPNDQPNDQPNPNT